MLDKRDDLFVVLSLSFLSSFFASLTADQITTLCFANTRKPFGRLLINMRMPVFTSPFANDTHVTSKVVKGITSTFIKIVIKKQTSVRKSRIKI